MSYRTRAQVRGKIEWELCEAWDRLVTAYRALAPLTQAVENLLEAAGDDEDDDPSGKSE